jgi:hypothetical protein
VSLALAEASALPGDGVNAWRSLTLPVLGVEAGIPPAVSQRPLRLSPRRWEWISGIHLPGRYLRFAYTIPAVLGAYRARSPASLRFAYACALPGDGVRTGYAVPCRWLWLEACALPAMGVVFGSYHPTQIGTQDKEEIERWLSVFESRDAALASPASPAMGCVPGTQCRVVGFGVRPALSSATGSEFRKLARFAISASASRHLAGSGSIGTAGQSLPCRWLWPEACAPGNGVSIRYSPAPLSLLRPHAIWLAPAALVTIPAVASRGWAGPFLLMLGYPTAGVLPVTVTGYSPRRVCCLSQ